MRGYDLTGKKFNRLTVLEVAESRPRFNKAGVQTGTRKYWKCRCECGKELNVVASSIVHGKTKSCGCYKTDYLKTRRGGQTQNWKGGEHIKESKGHSSRS